MSSNKPNESNKEEKYFFGRKKNFKTVNENGTSHEFMWPQSNSDSMKVLRYFKGKMAVDTDILFASPGIYTWLLRDETFYATEVASKQEIGTLHSNLVDFSTMQGNEGEIIAAGELKLEKEQQDVIKIKFNFLSGTYHKRFRKERSDEELVRIATKKLLSLKALKLRVSSVEYIGNTPLIDVTNLIASNHNMEALQTFFKKKTTNGGKRSTKRNKTKKRYVKNKKW